MKARSVRRATPVRPARLRVPEGGAAPHPGARASCAIIVPISKTAEWWSQDRSSATRTSIRTSTRRPAAPSSGHARAAEQAIATIYRRLFHNPDGYRARGRVRLRHLLRMRAGGDERLRPRAPVAAGYVTKPGVEVREGGACLEGEARVEVVRGRGFIERSRATEPLRRGVGTFSFWDFHNTTRRSPCFRTLVLKFSRSPTRIEVTRR